MTAVLIDIIDGEQRRLTVLIPHAEGGPVYHEFTLSDVALVALTRQCLEATARIMPVDAPPASDSDQPRVTRE